MTTPSAAHESQVINLGEQHGNDPDRNLMTSYQNANYPCNFWGSFFRIHFLLLKKNYLGKTEVDIFRKPINNYHWSDVFVDIFRKPINNYHWSDVFVDIFRKPINPSGGVTFLPIFYVSQSTTSGGVTFVPEHFVLLWPLC
jgi:hypothetical protein